MRIPIWPGIRLSVWEPQNPDAVKVTMACYYNPLKVTRVLSMRGWALLLLRYDWRDTGTYGPPVLDTAENAAWHSVWLHGNWRYLTKCMTTPEREYAAARVAAYSRYLAECDRDLERGEPSGLRWWREAGR